MSSLHSSRIFDPTDDGPQRLKVTVVEMSEQRLVGLVHPRVGLIAQSLALRGREDSDLAAVVQRPCGGR